MRASFVVFQRLTAIKTVFSVPISVKIVLIPASQILILCFGKPFLPPVAALFRRLEKMHQNN